MDGLSIGAESGKRFSLAAKIETLQKDIGYHFSDMQLLERALTHASLSKTHNQRLEYLGDALLGLVISDCLYSHHVNLSEGILTRQRAFLVSKATLLNLANRLKLHLYVRVGGSIGGTIPDSILADTVEAVFAAIYLDAGLTRAKQAVMYCYETYVGRDFLDVVAKDSKTLLQEFCQKHGYALPFYEYVQSPVPPSKQFTVRLTISDLTLAVESQATSKRQAEKMAAAQLLKQLEETGTGDYGSDQSRRS